MIWEDSLSVGNKEIDDQHKRLIELTQQLEEIFEKYLHDQFISDELIDVYNELQWYTIKHFRSEEALLLSVNYPKFEEHKLEHQKFVEFLEKINYTELKKGEYKSLLDILAFVSNWILNHIATSDKDYLTYL